MTLQHVSLLLPTGAIGRRSDSEGQRRGAAPDGCQLPAPSLQSRNCRHSWSSRPRGDRSWHG